MNKNRLYFGLIISVLVIIIIWTSVGMLGVNSKEEKYTVSVIVDDSNNDRWIAMREGLEQSAKDNNIQLNYVSTGTLAGIGEEKALIEREIENGADGMILQLVSSDDGYKTLENIGASIPVMLLETDAEPEGAYAVTAPDNKEIGRTLAEAVLEEQKEYLDNKKIGILSGNQKQLAMRQRLQGAEETLKSAGVEPQWVLSSFGQPLVGEIAEKQMQDAADIIISLGNSETEAAVDYLQSESGQRKSFLLYGEGGSEKAVYYLDKGIIKILVVPNEFNMGYQSMQAVAEQLKYQLSVMQSIKIDSLVINRDNLYDEENQKILFPIVQ